MAEIARMPESRSWIYALVLVLTVVLLSVFSEAYGRMTQENVLQHVNVYGHRIMSHDRLEGILDDVLGRPLSQVDPGSIRDLFLQYPLVKNARVSLRYPDGLDVVIRELIPVAYISIGRVLTVDASATLLPLPDNGMLYNLPIITRIPEELPATVIGEPVDSKTVQSLVKFLVDVRQNYSGIYLDISEIGYEEQAGIKLISARNSTLVFLGDWEQAKRSLAILSAFLDGNAEEENIAAYQYIDLRFENQVIVKER